MIITFSSLLLVKMVRMQSLYASILLIILFWTNSRADRVLFLVDNMSVRDSHSEFIKSLEQRGHTITLSMADDPSLALIKYGEFLFEHMVIFAPTVDEFGGSISVAEIAAFIDGGGNVLLAASTNLGDAIRDLATEVGFEFDEAKTMVIDHYNYEATLDDGTHTTIVVPSASQQLIANAPLLSGDKSKLGPVLYRGVGLMGDSSNPLRMVVMTAASTAYSFNPKNPVDEYPVAIGKSIVLIGAMQARNNARVLVTGSIDFFSNAFFNANVKSGSSTAEKPVKSGNQELATALSRWVLKEAGVLRIKSIRHHIIGQTSPPQEYTIMDDVHYEINIEELKDGKWVPFRANDVQLEFVRIDPFVRTTLKNNNNGKFSADFKIPDVYGVYKFLVDYHRIGYTHLYDVQQVSVRPLKHTQYERFSRCAYPYYISAFSMMIGVVLFSLVFLYYKESPSSGASASSQSSTAAKAGSASMQQQKTK